MFEYAEPKQEQKQVSKNTIKKQEQQPIIRPNQTGIPNSMKSRFESMSGFSFNDVRVHYNSDKPAQLQALAYTQGNQVHIAPGQENHLSHELGHVIQQKQGRVRPTVNICGFPVNDDPVLEREADSGVVQRQAVIRKETPAEKYLKSIGRTKNNPSLAIIGTDMFCYDDRGTEKEISPLKEGLKKYFEAGEPIPHSLAQHIIEKEGGRYDNSINERWMKNMIFEKKVFILAHTRIEGFLNEGNLRPEAFLRFASSSKGGPIKGTWKEVYMLLSQGYTWKPDVKLLVHPSIEKNITFLEILIENRKRLMSKKGMILGGEEKEDTSSTSSSSSSSSSSSPALAPASSPPTSSSTSSTSSSPAPVPTSSPSSGSSTSSTSSTSAPVSTSSPSSGSSTSSSSSSSESAVISALPPTSSPSSGSSTSSSSSSSTSISKGEKE